MRSTVIKSLVILVVLTLSTFSWSGIIDIPKQTLRYDSGTSTPVQTGNTAAISAPSESATFADNTRKGLITLAVDHHYPKIIAENHTSVEFEVTPYSVLGTPGTPFTVILEVDYKPNGELEFNDKSIYELDNVLAFDILIRDILVDGSPADLPENLYIDAELYIDRIFDFSDWLDQSPDVEVVNSSKILDTDCDDVDDALLVRWDPVREAEEYQVEWTYVNDYTDQNGVYLDAEEVVFNFRKNSSRITTNSNEYRIPLTYDHGYVIYRVRAVGRLYTDPVYLQFSEWSLPESGMVDPDGGSDFYQITEPWEQSKNWQYSVTFAEEGKRKEVVSFYDGSLRNRQMVTLVSTNSKAIVGETLYDHQGRPAIQVLPVPVSDPTCGLNGSNTLKYYDNFNKNLNDSSYNRRNFDLSPGEACSLSVAAMNTNSGAANYYSSSNPEADGIQGYVPSAGGYPFSQVEYTPDNTGRIRRQGGVGEKFQLGSGHEIKYFYGHPSQIELDRLFGSEVGCASHYQKNMVVDPNGQVSVSYLDQEGRVIATALAGNSPDSLIALESEAISAVTLSDNIVGLSGVCDNEESSGETSQTVNQTVLISSTTDVQINYSQEIGMFTDECLAEDICFGCVYDLAIEFKDQCGQSLIPDSISNLLTGHFEYFEANDSIAFTLDCGENEVENSPLTILIEDVPVGSYQMSKTLSLNQDALAFYSEQYMNPEINTCFKTLEDFQQEYLENADYSGCGPDTTCQQCLDGLPTWEYFEENELGTLEAYNALVAECDALCEPSSMSGAYRDFLLMDMQPGGQYAEYLLTNGTFHPEQFSLSILNASNQLPREDDWHSPVYEKNGVTYNKYYDDDLVTESKVWLTVYFDVNGDINSTQPSVLDTALVEFDTTEQEYYTIAQNLLSTEDFVNEFKTSWANSLIYYHPEYLILKTYEQLAEPDVNGKTSEEFDHLMEQTNTWDEAIANGFIKSGYASETVNNRLYDLSTPSLSHAYDPFLDSLADTVRWTNYKNAFLYALNTKYQSISSTNYTMAQVAAFTGRCGDEIGGSSFSGNCFGFGFNATGSSSGGSSPADKAARNKDWQNFKSFYRSLKQQYIAQISLVRSIEEPDYYGYNGCIGAASFNPYTGGFLAPGFDILQSQYLNHDQPCFFANVDLYENKVKRFMLPSDVGGTGNGIDFSLSAAELSDQALLAGYTYAGDCPLATGLLTLCDNMADAGDLLATSYSLPDNPGFVAFVNTYQGITEPVTPLPAMQWDAIVVNDSTLYIEITDISGTVAEIQFELFEDSLVNWNDVDGFAGIQAVGTGGLGYRFTAHAVAYYPDSTVYYPLEGSTSLDIFHCTFPDNCQANDLGSDLLDLMNAMALTGEAFSTTSVAIKGTGADTIYIPFVTDRIAEILSGTTTPATDVYWQYNSGKLRIGKTGAAPSREITLTIDNLFSVYTYFSGIAAFSSMTITGDNTAVFAAVDDNGVFVCNLECSVDFEINRIPVDLNIGSCASPQLGCDGTEYQNATDLESLLKDVLVNQNPSYNLHASQAMTNSLIGQFPGVASTSSTTVLDTVYAIEQSLTGLVFDHQTIATVGTTTTTKTYYTQVTATHELLLMDSVVCEEGETGSECDSVRVIVTSTARAKTIFDKTTIGIGDNCSLVLNYKHDFVSGFDISDVTEVTSFTLVGPVYDDGYYHKFKLMVEIDGSKTDSIFGEFCLPMLPCNPITPGFNPTEPFPVVVIEDPCYALVTGAAMDAAEQAFNAYTDSLLLDFTTRYEAHCMSTVETFGRQYDQKEYHFTLYYYDQAGNLVKTIPPEGVEQLPIISSSDEIATMINEDRTNGTHSVITNHRMATVYAYNSLNQLVAQHMPDMDDMSTWTQSLPSGLDANLVTTAIQMVDNSIGYLTGYLTSSSSPTGSRGYLYRTLDGGTNWTRLTSLFLDDLAKVRMADQNNGFAVGSNGTVLKTTDGGTSWDLMDLHTAGITGSFVDLAVHSSTVAAFLRSDGAIMKLSTTLSTALYTPAVSGLTLNSIRSIEPLDGSSGVYSVSAEFTASGNTFTELLKIDLTGSGTTTEEESRGAQWNTVYYCSSTLGIAGGQDGDIMYLAESGSAGTGTQYHQSSNIVGNILDVAFVNKQNGMAIVDDGGAGNIFCYYTTDAGVTWTKVLTTGATSMAVMTQSSSIMYVAVSYTDGNVRFYSMNSSGSITLKWTKLVSTNYDKMTFYYNDFQNIIGDRYAIVATNGLNVYVSGLVAVSSITGPAFNSYFTWASGSAPTDIKAVKVSTTVHVVAIRGNTTVSDLYSIGWNGSTPTATEVVISPASTAFKSLQMVVSGSYVLAYEHNNRKIHRLVLTSSAPSSGGLTAISASTSLLASGIIVADMALHDNYVTLVGAEGRAVSCTTQVTSSSTTNLAWQERSTMRLLPIRDISRTNYTATNTYKGLAVGDLGTIFRRNSSASIWYLLPAAKTNNLKGVSYAMVSTTPYACVYGDATAAFRITLSTNAFTNLSFTTTPTGNFTDISLTAVSSTGYAIISSDNGYTYYTASLTSGTPTLSRSSSAAGYQVNSLCFAPQNSVTPTAISVGNGGKISKLLSNVATPTDNVFGPKLNNVHFANSTMGTVVGEKFFVRSTTSSASSWTKVFPSTINSANLQKNPLEVWTRATTAVTPEHYAIIGGADYLATIYNAVATGGSFGNNQTITDIRFDAEHPNIGYISQYNKLYRINLSVSGSSYSTSTGDALSGGTVGTTINAIHVFAGEGIDNAVMMVGNDMISYKAHGSTTTTNMLGGIAGDIRDVVFTDLNHGYVTGYDGLFYQTDAITFNAFGTAYTAMSWLQRSVTDVYTGTAPNVDICALEFPSATHAVWGGSFNTSPGGSAPAVRVLNVEHQQYSSRFYYDRLGRIVASQNSRQKGENKYSYSLYDALGRVIEAGEKTENSSGAQFAGVFGTNVGGQFITSVIDDTKLNNWITTQSTTTRKEVTRSYYDELNPEMAAGALGSYYSFNVATQRKRIVHVTYEQTYDGMDSTYDHATHYDYDIHGNVKTLIQDNKKLGALTSLSTQRFKKMEYVFDLISGNVHRVDFQTGKADQWHHAYVYDADNRITDVYTTTATPLTNTASRTSALQLEPTLSPYWDKEANYDYYYHGPLARTEIGDQQVQGLDYAYTLQGWIKGVNSNTLDVARDPGQDGESTGASALVARDVMSYSLHYYKGDYQRINTSTYDFVGDQDGSDLEKHSFELFNGNIASMVTTITHPDTREVLPLGNAYKYDQLNRLKQALSFTNLNMGTNEWGSGQAAIYRNTFLYDANGNILNQNRSDENGAIIDSLTYKYHQLSNGKTIRNRLYHVDDYVNPNAYSDDIDDMGVFSSGAGINSNNYYVYDAEGRLIKDRLEDILSIEWRVDGKIKKINRTNASSKKNVSFDYDAMGHRIAKHVYTSANVLESSTYYILDAQGNVMSTYKREIISSTVSYSQREKYIYGSSRLGVLNDSIPLYGSQNATYDQTKWEHTIGSRNYELSNHLGNILSVVSDKPIPHDDGGGVSDYFLADIRQSTDYSPFGVQLSGRNHYKTGVWKDYSMGFQGQLEDDEIKGEGNSLNYEYRMHDPRLGRFFAIDPLAADFSWNSPYAFSENRVIDCIELEGLEKVEHYTVRNDGTLKHEWTEIDNTLKQNINLYHTWSKGQIIQTKLHYKQSGTDRYVTYNGTADMQNVYLQLGVYKCPWVENAETAIRNEVEYDNRSTDQWEGPQHAPLDGVEISLSAPSISYKGITFENQIVIRETGLEGGLEMVQVSSVSATSDYSNEVEFGAPSITMDFIVNKGDDSKPDVSLEVQGQYNAGAVSVSTNANGENKVSIGLTLPTTTKISLDASTKILIKQIETKIM